MLVAIPLYESASFARSSSPRTSSLRSRSPFAKSSAAEAALRTGVTTWCVTRFVIAASSTSRASPPTSMVLCTVVTVFWSVLSGNSR